MWRGSPPNGGYALRGLLSAAPIRRPSSLCGVAAYALLRNYVSGYMHNVQRLFHFIECYAEKIKFPAASS